MKMEPKQYDDDDGRVICDMDVDGMRWHDRRIRHEKKSERKLHQTEQMTRSETRRYNWYVILAILVIGSVFSVTWILFTLFCTKIWFR